MPELLRCLRDGVLSAYIGASMTVPWSWNRLEHAGQALFSGARLLHRLCWVTIRVFASQRTRVSTQVPLSQ